MSFFNKVGINLTRPIVVIYSSVGQISSLNGGCQDSNCLDQRWQKD